jgi:hypothetical protein
MHSGTFIFRNIALIITLSKLKRYICRMDTPVIQERLLAVEKLMGILYCCVDMFSGDLGSMGS